MIYYLLVLLIWLVAFEKHRYENHHNDFNKKGYKHQLKKYSIAIFPICLIMGLRHVSVGNDTIQYLNRYDNSFNHITDAYMQSEYGYNYLCYFFHDILCFEWQSYLMIVSAFVCFSLLILLINLSTNVYLGLYLYVTIGLFYMNMSGLRQSIAIALCTLAILIVLSDKKNMFFRKICAIGIVYIAFTIHNSAFVYFPIIFCTNLNFSKKQVFLMLLFASSTFFLRSIIVQFAVVLLPNRYQSYELNAEYSANILTQIIPIVIPLYCLFVSKTDEDGKYSKEISLMYLFAALNIFFMCLIQSNNQIGRLSFYFINCYTVLIPYAFSSQARNAENRLMSNCVIFICMIYFLLGTIGGTLHIDEYKFFWQ